MCITTLNVNFFKFRLKFTKFIPVFLIKEDLPFVTNITHSQKDYHILELNINVKILLEKRIVG